MIQHLPLVVEKPAAGGRMIARHEGRIVLVSGAIPGERVSAAVEQVRGGVIYATTVSVESASPDRRPPFADPACGGSVYSHISYARQLSLKGEIVADAFRRIGRIELERAVPVRPSREDGYRMRARLHVRGSAIGFFREGTHSLCDPAPSRQLLPATLAVVERLAERLAAAGVRGPRELELTENVSADERAVLIELEPGASGAARQVLHAAESDGLTGIVVAPVDAPDRTASRGRPWVTDRLELGSEDESSSVRRPLTLRRHVASFFQGNRYLLEPLVQTVISSVPDGEVVDLYAGAGLFGLACAAAGRRPVVTVEGDRHSAHDLAFNARPFGADVRVHASSVETYLAAHRISEDATVIVDPPRTGLSRRAGEAVASSGAARLVYVSCDVATLARDARRFLDAGYALAHVEAFDLFPNTAHVEALAVLDRAGAQAAGR